MQIQQKSCVAFVRAATAAAVVTAFATAPAAAQVSPELRQIIDRAKQEKELVVSWAQNTLGGLEGSEIIAKAMSRKYGFNVRIKYSPGPSMTRTVFKIATEAKAGQKAFTDVNVGPSFTVAELVKRDLYIQHPWSKLLPGRITPDVVEMDNRLVRVVTTLPGVTVNTDLLPGGKRPRKLTDFLKPEWKDKIVGTPYAASFEAISSTVMMGPEKSVELVRQLSEQMPGVIRCAEAERIANGEYAALVMDCNSTAAKLWKSRGAPVEHLLLEDYAQKRFYYLGVPKNAANPNLATLFIVFGMTEEGQQIYRDVWKLDLDSFPGSMQGKLVADLEKRGAKFIDVTVPFWLDHPEMATAKRQMVKILRGRGKRKN